MDKLIHNLVQKAKKNKFLAFPALLCVFVLIFAKNIAKVVVDLGHMTRTKKIIAAVMAAVLVIGIVGPLSTMFRSTKVNAGTNPFLADWTDTQPEYYWYTSVQAQGGMEYVIDSVRDLCELAEIVNGSANVPGVNGSDNFYGKTVWFNFTELDFACREFPVIGSDAEHPFLGSFKYKPASEENLVDIDRLVADHFYSEDAMQELFGNKSISLDRIKMVEQVGVNEEALMALTGDSECMYDGDSDTLYLPLDENSQDTVREYPVFYSYRTDNDTPWRGELAYKQADTQPNDKADIIKEARMDGTLAVCVGVEGSYKIKAYPEWDYANENKPEKELTVSVVPRNVITADNTIILKKNKGDEVSLSDCNISAVNADIASATVIENTNASVSISGDKLSGQKFVVNKNGETKIHISSGRFSSDDKDIRVIVVPPVDSIEWRKGQGGEAASADSGVNYIVYYDANDDKNWIELIFNLKNGNSEVTSEIISLPNSPIEVSCTGEDMTYNGGNQIILRPSEEHYQGGKNVEIIVKYGDLESKVIVSVQALNPPDIPTASPSNATRNMIIEDESESTPEETSGSGGESLAVETESDKSESALESEVTEEESEQVSDETKEDAEGVAEISATEPSGEVNADFGIVLQRKEEFNALPYAMDMYQGEVFDQIDYNRYHKVVVESNNGNDRYSVAVTDKDEAEESHCQVKDGNIYVHNDYDCILHIILEPTYEIRGNVVLYPYPLGSNNTSIVPTGELLEQLAPPSIDVEKRKTCSYVLKHQEGERYPDCQVLIQDIQSTNTNISAIEFNGVNYPLSYDGSSVDADYYIVNVKYADFPIQESDVTAERLVVTESVKELYILNVQINEEHTLCTVSGYIRPQDGQTDMANFNLTINRLENEEADLNQLYIGEDLICDFVQPDADILLKEPENEEGITVCKIVYKGSRDLTEVVESDIRLEISENAVWSGVMQEGVVSPNLFLNKYEDTKMLMFDVMVNSQDGQNHTKYRIILQSEDMADAPSSITIPDKVQYDPLQYQYIITDILQNADYSVAQTELVALAGGDGEEYTDAQQNILRDKAQLFVEQDLLIYGGLQVNVTADVEYNNQYIPAKGGTAYGVPGPNGEDGVYYFKAYITSNNGTEDVIWDPISGKVTVRAAKYVPATVESIVAVNGNISVVLKDIPTECAPEKFEVEYSVDVLDAAGNVQVSGQRTPWGQLFVASAGDGINYAITTPILGQREQRQRVTVYVRYHQDSNTNEPFISDSYELGANDQCMLPQSTILDRDGNVLGKTGVYEKTVYVKLNSSNAGIENDVYYYVEGSADTAYKKYETPIEISSDSTIHAYAENRNAYMSNSGVMTENYIIRIPVGTSAAEMVNTTGSPAVTASGMEPLIISQRRYLGGAVGAIRLWLEVSDWAEDVTDLMLSQNEKIRSQAKALNDYCRNNGYYDYCTYDIRLMREATDNKGYAIPAMSGEITSELSDAVQIILTLPGELANRSDLQVLRVHTFTDGTIGITALEDLDTNPNTYTFETELMSLYAIVAKMNNHVNPSYGNVGGGNAGADIDNDDDDTPSGGGGGFVVITPTSGATQQTNPTYPTQTRPASGTQTGVASGSNNAVSNNGAGISMGGQQNPTAAVVGNTNTTNKSGNTANEATKTGDKSPIILLVIVLVISFILMIVVFIWGLKRRK